MDRILIVDDDQAIAYLIADALEDEGFEIIICHDGNEALEKIEESCEISLMILDIMMPKMDGLELCRRVRDQLKAPIIFVSAKSRTLDTLLGLEMGADDYIAKPFNINILLDLEKILIGGGISAQPVLLDSLKKSIRDIATYHVDIVKGTYYPLPVIDVCRFHNEANLLGALYHFMFE